MSSKVLGGKEVPLKVDEMSLSLYKSVWKNRSLEVVAYTKAEGIAGAEIVAECGCDVLMGTCFHNLFSRSDICLSQDRLPDALLF